MKSTKFEGYSNQFTITPYHGSEITGVKGFGINENYIIVQFKDDRTYLYNEHFPGKEHVFIMKQKALKGERLGSYINQHVRDNYFAYWDKDEEKFKLNKKFN